MRVRSIGVVFSLALLLSSCYKDYDNTTKTDIPSEPITLVNTKLSGSFMEQSGVVIQDYTLSWGDESVEVSNGYFLVSLQSIDKHDLTMIAESETGEKGLAHMAVVENDVNTTEIVTLSQPENYTVQPDQTLKLSEGLSLSVPESVSSLELTVRANTSADGLLSHGYDKDGGLVVLSGVELYDIDPTGGNVDIVLQVSSSSELFQLVDGKWRQLSLTGTGVKVPSGIFAIGQSTPAVFVGGQVLKDDLPASYQSYQIRESRLVSSTAKGNWIQALGTEADHNIDIIDPCGQYLDSKSITVSGSSSDTDILLGDEVLLQQIQTVMIDCAGELAEIPTIRVQHVDGSVSLHTYSSPEIESYIPVCDGMFDIAAYDIEQGKVGLAVPWSTSIEDDLSYLNTCPDGYSYYRIGEYSKLYPAFDVSVTAEEIEITSSDGLMLFSIKGDGKGAYDVEDVNIKIYDEDFGPSGFAVSCESSPVGCGITDCYVSHLVASDDIVRVTFSGTVWMQTLDPLTASTYEVEGIFVSQL